MRLSFRLYCTIGLALTVAPTCAPAEVRLPSIFGDHMVLQRGKTIPVWGTAAVGEAVAVTLGKDRAATVANAQGQWRVDLKPLEPGSATEMVVKGKNTITFSDVLVGDVWLESGQSNMQFGVKKDYQGAALVASANEPLIRIFSVRLRTAIAPESDLPAAVPGSTPYEGVWLVSTPETLASSGSWDGFSAVGFYFGREIQRFTHQPVGLIESVWGGTPAEAWTSMDGLRKDPILNEYVVRHDQLVANHDATVAALPEAQKKAAEWDRTVKPRNEAATKAWQIAVKQATVEGTPLPAKPTLASRPATPDPAGGSRAPASLWNGMIAPLVPYAIEGAIWYQGESNSKKGIEYRTLLPRMIGDWREHWGEGDFPFIFVQLADFNEDYALLREAQAMTLSLPKTGMAVAIDVGNRKDIHPIFKEPVGHRLALSAEQVAYGSSAGSSGPVYKSVALQGDTLRVSFDHAAGLKIGSYPINGNGYLAEPTDRLYGFTVAGEDRQWHEATAKIENDTILVRSAEVPKPLVVRYGWEAAFTTCNLYNGIDLPASPFRSDDWPVK